MAVSSCHANATSAALANTTASEDEADQLLNTIFYIYLTLPTALLGIAGNVLNLATLQNKLLCTEPFMYIRAMAVFDLSALCLILHTTLVQGKVISPTSSKLLAFYWVRLSKKLPPSIILSA